MSQNPPQTNPGGSPWNDPQQSQAGAGQPAAPQPTGQQQGQQPPQAPAHTGGQPQQGHSGPSTGGPTPDLDPKLDGRAKTGISGGTWVALIVGLIILILLLVFILQNMNDVLITYMAWEFSLPLGVAMLLAAIAGALIMAMAGSIRLIVVTRRLHKLEKERESIKRTLG